MSRRCWSAGTWASWRSIEKRADIRSVTGQNFRNIMLLLRKSSVELVKKEDVDKIEYFPLYDTDRWNIRKSVWNVKKSVWNARKGVWNVRKSVWNARKSVWNISKSVWNAGKSVWNTRKSV